MFSIEFHTKATSYPIMFQIIVYFESNLITDISYIITKMYAYNFFRILTSQKNRVSFNRPVNSSL